MSILSCIRGCLLLRVQISFSPVTKCTAVLSKKIKSLALILSILDDAVIGYRLNIDNVVFTWTNKPEQTL